VIVVIQCAATKQPNAGYFRDRTGQKVYFVGDPTRAPAYEGAICARPDDSSPEGLSWRELVRHYNEKEKEKGNPFELLPAIALYQHPAYRRLAEAFGRSNVYILSAGWGLISADFLTPAYDITFSAAAEPYKRRMRADRYWDFCMLPNTGEPVCFLGGKDYVPLFVELTKNLHAPRTVMYNSAIPPRASGCRLERFQTSTRTNWHYEYAVVLADASKSKASSH
jgi:hypothetical protein